MSVGEPQDAPPSLLAETVAAHADAWNRYPPALGTPEFRQRGDRLSRAPLSRNARPHRSRRADLAGHEHARRPLSRRVDRDEPLAHDAARADAEPVLPDLSRRRDHGRRRAPLSAPTAGFRNSRSTCAQLDEATLARTSILYLCSPSNPDGHVIAARGDASTRSTPRAGTISSSSSTSATPSSTTTTPPHGALDVLAAMDRLGSAGSTTRWCCIRCPSVPAPPGCGRDSPSARPTSSPRSIACGSTAPAARRCRCSPRRRRCGRRTRTSTAMRARLSRRKDTADRCSARIAGYYRPALRLLPVDPRRRRDRADATSVARLRAQGAAGRLSHPARRRTGPTTAQAFVRIALVHDPETTRPGSRGSPSVSASLVPGRRAAAGVAATRRAPSPSARRQAYTRAARTLRARTGRSTHREDTHDEATGSRRGASGRSSPARAYAGKTLDAIKQRGAARLRRQSEPAGLLGGRQPGQLDRPRRRRLQGDRRVDARRRQEGQVGAAQRVAALHRAAVGRDRHPVAQHDLDADARRVARPRTSPASPTTTARASWCRRSPRSRAPSS